MEKELQRTDTNDSFNIFDEVEIVGNDLDIDGDNDTELNSLMNMSSLDKIDGQIDVLFTQINAKLPSDDENDLNHSNTSIVSLPHSNEVNVEEKETDEEEEEK